MVTQRPELDSLVPAGADEDVLGLNRHELCHHALVTRKGLQSEPSKG